MTSPPRWTLTEIFLNYGGPARPFSTNKADIEKMAKACESSYGDPVRQSDFEIKGIEVSVRTYGIHRALHLKVSDSCSEETYEQFLKAGQAAKKACETQYNLLGNNCVTSVAKVLNTLDDKITAKDVFVPWNLDKTVKSYTQALAVTGTAKEFMQQYTESIKQDRMAFLKTNHWLRNEITSLTDIVAHAYGKNGNSGEKTKSTLLGLAWVRENKEGILTPTSRAPKDFAAGLTAYNEDYAKALELKKMYKNETTLYSMNVHRIFKDNPDFETALNRIQTQAEKNPGGAASKVLLKMQQSKLFEKSSREPVKSGVERLQNQSDFKKRADEQRCEVSSQNKAEPDTDRNLPRPSM